MHQATLCVEGWVSWEANCAMEISMWGALWIGSCGKVKGPEIGCDTVTRKASVHLGRLRSWDGAELFSLGAERPGLYSPVLTSHCMQAAQGRSYDPLWGTLFGLRQLWREGRKCGAQLSCWPSTLPAAARRMLQSRKRGSGWHTLGSSIICPCAT